RRKSGSGGGDETTAGQTYYHAAAKMAALPEEKAAAAAVMRRQRDRPIITTGQTYYHAIGHQLRPRRIGVCVGGGQPAACQLVTDGIDFSAHEPRHRPREETGNLRLVLF
ncbi:MAG: hypothetical protein RLZZ282_1422, partial [Verrucomicrobiota bacterium]